MKAKSFKGVPAPDVTRIGIGDEMTRAQLAAVFRINTKTLPPAAVDILKRTGFAWQRKPFVEGAELTLQWATRSGGGKRDLSAEDLRKRQRLYDDVCRKAQALRSSIHNALKGTSVEHLWRAETDPSADWYWPATGEVPRYTLNDLLVGIECLQRIGTLRLREARRRGGQKLHGPAVQAAETIVRQYLHVFGEVPAIEKGTVFARFVALAFPHYGLRPPGPRALFRIVEQAKRFGKTTLLPTVYEICGIQWFSELYHNEVAARIYNERFRRPAIDLFHR